MNELKINTRLLCQLSKLVNKMGISSLIMKINIDTDNELQDKESVAKELVALIIDNLYKVEDELTEFISKIKGISVEEAQNEDVIPIIKELLSNEKIKDFLKLT